MLLVKDVLVVVALALFALLDLEAPLETQLLELVVLVDAGHVQLHPELFGLRLDRFELVSIDKLWNMSQVSDMPTFSGSHVEIKRECDGIKNVRFSCTVRSNYSSKVRERANDM